jgi:hypothetical protein
MAVDTAVTAQTGAASLGQKIVIYQREVNFATTNLTSGDHFQLFSLPAESLVIGGQVEILLAGTATTDVTIGKTTGTELLTGANLDGTAGTVTVFTATTGVSFDSDTIDLAVDTATAILGRVLVTCIVAYCDTL